MTRKQVRKHDRICLAIVLIIGAVLMVHTAVAAVRGASERKRQEEQRKQEIRERIENADSLADLSAGVARALNGTMTGIETGEQATLDADIENIGAFDTMSMDYGGEEDGFVFYEIPEEYQATGGYFPEEAQIYTYCLCKQYGVRYSLVVAMIERESSTTASETMVIPWDICRYGSQHISTEWRNWGRRTCSTHIRTYTSASTIFPD